MSNRFSSHGIEVEFDDNSEAVLSALRNAVERGLMAIGETAVTYAKKSLTEQKAVDTGRLRNSVNYLVNGEDVYIGTPVEYGIYVECGTGKYVSGGRPTPWVYQDANGNWHWTQGNPARPFIVPAAKNHTKEYRNLLKDSLENA